MLELGWLILPLGTLAAYVLKLLDLRGTILAFLLGLALQLLGGAIALVPILALLGGSFLARRLVPLFVPAAKKEGRRSSANVLANGLGPLLFLLMGTLAHSDHALAWYTASVAAALADTLGSDIGIASRRVRSILPPFTSVPPGTDGGISWLGSIATVLGALLVPIIMWWAGGLDATGLAVCSLGGVVGATVDSLLGWGPERQGLMGKSAVNFSCTAAGGFVAVLLL